MKKLKIRTKIMLWFTLLSAVLLCVLIPTVYTTVAASLRQTLDANLQTTISQILASAESQNGSLILDTEELDLRDDTSCVILSSDGRILEASNNARWLAQAQPSVGDSTVIENGKSWAVRSQVLELDETKITIMAASLTDYVDESLNDLKLLLLLLVPVYLCVSAFGSFLLAKRAMRPIHAITETARVIAGGDMAQRISGVEAKDEVGELAETFNGMLDTLEISFKRERQFTSDASHELRTPITVISACVEDALGDEKADGRENLEMIKSEALRMTKIISQLLMLSRGYEFAVLILRIWLFFSIISHER